ncbi:MAG TPA: DUF3854 domain-containing protein [Bryobacteraceae bacterium]|nr:DUF3854 domain-containing protein [Bryobacteraceae bacterium]
MMDGQPQAIPESGARIPPSEGGPLNERDYATLDRSWITKEIADEAMLRRVDDYAGREVIGQKGKRDCAGLLIPYYWPGEPYVFNYRLRRDNPDWTTGTDGKPRVAAKYLGPPNSSNRLYVPPGVTPEHLQDFTIPIAITEGEKKALALWRLAYYETRQPRFIPIAISGVWNWRGKVGKTNGPAGDRIDIKGPINDLAQILWKDREVFIVFDANVHTNDSVKWARKGIARELVTRGAQAKLINLPKDCGVNGIDDLLAAWGPDRVLSLFETPVAATRLEVVLPPQFQSRAEGMFRFYPKADMLFEVQLTNFQAKILANSILDDGVETKREFEIETTLLGCVVRFTIPASDFTKMDWPIERMGGAAIIFPNMRDYARTAIQWSSMAAEERRTYTYTGWRKTDSGWIFLHSGGAIGENGAQLEAKVRLSGAMTRYELQLPAGPEGSVSAVKTSLRLLELGPPAISFALLAATYRAVLGNADFALHLVGETGAFKSELAALHQQHYGASMDRQHLPGSWSSTGNALESLAFHAKDTLFVIDDFAPQGSSVDVGRYHAAADRVFRAAGNHSGRSRLDSSAELREQKPPRALILSTGEDIPRGQSIRARMMILELNKGEIQGDELSVCQKFAKDGVYTETMSAFIKWLARDFESRRKELDRKVEEFRGRAVGTLHHARTPEIVANLYEGFALFSEFAEHCGAIEDWQREELNNRCWNALLDAARNQAKHQAATEPVARFLDLLRSSLVSGRAHLRGRSGPIPEKWRGACGWRDDGGYRSEPSGDCIGWVDGDELYLDSTASYRVVQIAGRDAGEILAITEQTLRKRLREKDLLASTDLKRETLTVRRTIEGTYKDVLHFRRSTLLPDGLEHNECAAEVDEPRTSTV